MSAKAKAKFDIAENTVTIMQGIADERANLESSVSCIAKAIIADSSQGTECFTAARGLYLSAKGNSAAQSGISDDWKRLTRALWNHFDRANLSASWPNIRSGKGAFSLVAKEQASEEKRAKAVEKAESEKLELARFKEKQQQQQIDQIKAMSPESLTAHIAHLLAVWGGDAQSQMSVIQSVMSGVESRLIAQSAAELRRNEKAAQSAAKREAKRTQKASTA